MGRAKVEMTLDQFVTAEGRVHEMTRNLANALQNRGASIEDARVLWSMPIFMDRVVDAALGMATIEPADDRGIINTAVLKKDRIKAIQRTTDHELIFTTILDELQDMEIRKAGVKRIAEDFGWNSTGYLCYLGSRCSSKEIAEEIVGYLSEDDRINLALGNCCNVVFKAVLESGISVRGLKTLLRSKTFSPKGHREIMGHLLKHKDVKSQDALIQELLHDDDEVVRLIAKEYLHPTA